MTGSSMVRKADFSPYSLAFVASAISGCWDKQPAVASLLGRNVRLKQIRGLGMVLW